MGLVKNFEIIWVFEMSRVKYMYMYLQFKFLWLKKSLGHIHCIRDIGVRDAKVQLYMYLLIYLNLYVCASTCTFICICRTICPLQEICAWWLEAITWGEWVWFSTERDIRGHSTLYTSRTLWATHTPPGKDTVWFLPQYKN